MIDENHINLAVDVVLSGGIIAYPTESVIGLGCDPFNSKAVKKLLEIKKRNSSKGLILIASHIQQILPLIRPTNASDLARALKTWPGHYTWVFPKSSKVPQWVSGNLNTVAVRVSKHSIVKCLCDKLKFPLISTSANISKQTVFTSYKQIKIAFNDKIDFYIDGEIGQHEMPSSIRDAHSNIIIR